MNKIILGNIKNFTGSVLSVQIPYNKSYDRDYFLTNIDITLTKNAPKLNDLGITNDLYGICAIRVLQEKVLVNARFPIIYYTDGSILINVLGTLNSMYINIENIASNAVFEVPKQKIYFFRPPDTVNVANKYITTNEGYLVINTEDITLFSISLESDYPNGIPIKENGYIVITDKNIKIPISGIGLAKAIIVNHGDIYVECRLSNGKLYLYNDYSSTGFNIEIFIPNQEIIFM